MEVLENMSSILREMNKGRLGNYRPSFFLALSVTQRMRPKQDLQGSEGGLYLFLLQTSRTSQRHTVVQPGSLSASPQPSHLLRTPQTVLSRKVPLFCTWKASPQCYLNPTPACHRNPLCVCFSHLPATQNCGKAVADTLKGSDVPTPFGKNDSYKKNVMHEISTQLLCSIP